MPGLGYAYATPHYTVNTKVFQVIGKQSPEQ